MTTTLSVREALENPAPFEKGFRLAIRGALYLDENNFCLFQIADDGTWDESVRIDVVDCEAAVAIRKALSAKGVAGDYIGEALAVAWTRIEATRVVLRDVVTVYLNDGSPMQVDVRA